ncbi:hypothetical protein RSOL_318710, partial [Rhizoctonia solani AG-3 Rhs1AP]
MDMDRPNTPGANHTQTTPNALYSTPTTPTSLRTREVPEVPILFIPAGDQDTGATLENTPALSDLPLLPDSENGSTASLYDEDEAQQEGTNVDKEDNDLLPRISSMYRLLDLFYETGSAGQGGLALHNEHDAEKAYPVLRSGLYLVLPPEHKQGDELFTAYIIYWPESTTWFDNANWSVQRNRVTFMRYLTQLSDQVVALVSTKQASLFSWDSGTRNTEIPTTQISEDDDDDSRMFTFEVAKLDEQEEDVICIPGFKAELWNLAEDKHVKLIGGETTMGVLISSEKPSTKVSKNEKEEYNRFRLKTLWDRPVILSEKISREGLCALMDNGLREKYSTLFTRYESEMSEHSAKFHHNYQLSMAEIQRQLEDEKPQIEKQIRNLTRARSYQFRAFTNRHQDHELADKRPPSQPISDQYSFILELANKWAREPPMAHIRNDRFQQLKTHISIIRYIFGLKETTDIEQRAIINRVIQEGYESLRELHDSKGTSILGKIFNGLGRLIGVKAEEWYKNHKGTSYFEQQSDLDFLSGLHALVGEYPLLFDICQQVFSVLTKYLEDRENQFVSMNLPKAIADTKQRREEQKECFLKNACKANESASWDQLWRDVYGEMEKNKQGASVLCIKEVVIQSKHGHRDPTFILHITHTSWTPKNTHYAFHPFELTQQDFQECQNDITFIPHPILQKRAQLEFDLEEARTVEFIQPMHSVCLVIVGSSQELSVFMNKNMEVGHAIRGQGHKIRLHRDNLGNELLYAYDEIARILVLLHGGLNNPKITWYAFDENYSSLKNGGTISLIDWYEDNSVAIRHMCFVTGKTDICLIDSSNSARVLSLDSEQFGPASLHIGAQVRDAFSAPDGSCLFVTVEDPETNKLMKPTDGKLFAIDVGWSSEPPVITLQRSLDSKFHFGEFIVKLLCLIPIHLAVTKENCFIPLKDGVLNPTFERKLLGADVPTIINSLSVGWYESLFRSYMATKPVRVVSSMGEQSVGVQSIERSAQEDTLLVLFNAAMSNMVLFRNNFAISRNIAGLFKSFQSSAAVLDPQSSPELFNSDLAIIIKDVINSDAKEIVREFSQKFKSIVREEKEQNFMTRLHRGQVHIIPWPVIKSRGFYTLFHRLRNTLENQPFTHGGAGVFLFTLKTLMAKIKANDWGALDKNLAAHRAQQLADWISEAIGRGGIELSNGVWGPLKDIDTDQDIAYNSPISDSVFWVPNDQSDSAEANETLMENILEKLTQTYATYPGQRQALPETAYISELQDTLNAQFDQRVEQVRDWMLTNVKRFPRENQDIPRRLVVYLRDMKGATYAKLGNTPVDNYAHYQRILDVKRSALRWENKLKAINLKGPDSEPKWQEIDHADDHVCSARMHFCGKEHVALC